MPIVDLKDIDFLIAYSSLGSETELLFSFFAPLLRSECESLGICQGRIDHYVTVDKDYFYIIQNLY